MDFNLRNFINTTTAITVSTNDVLKENLINPDLNFQYFSGGDDSDLTTTSITINFGSTTNVSRIALLNHNFKDYTIFYNGVTTNTFPLNSGDTTTTDYSSNSESSQYFSFNTTAVSSVTIDATGTITPNAEKFISLFYISDCYFTFDRIPSAQSYKPIIDAKQIIHKMGDGGTKIHNIDFKRSIDIKYKYLSLDQQQQLKTLYDIDDAFYFCLFPTSTGWDKIFFEANWIGGFDFERYSDNAATAGFSGTIKLRET